MITLKFRKRNKSQQAVDLLAQGGVSFPVFSKLVSICGTVNASNAQSERFFSIANWLAAGRRASMGPKLLKDSVLVHELGESVGNYSREYWKKVSEA